MSADVIARACFGSSFTKGEEIFCKLRKYLPTKSNQEIRMLDEQVRLLNAIVDGAQDGRSVAEAEDFVVGNCKTIYFGGHESTAVTAILCLMLLATHPEWQERAWAEAMEVCRERMPLDVDALRRLKL
ncbi:hypothetical protein E2562_025177 [Oryza meyeriana var. granulata]|uniref:Cytochrome P450 n=1 Tax=Oryza meyeriana var. granulata TaxID=110450 RepID=A0A6G1E0E8_9ORYZ|nr:hypothetical protein E2562_025177 [Oryza meyeriana var. granulata]